MLTEKNVVKSFRKVKEDVEGVKDEVAFVLKRIAKIEDEMNKKSLSELTRKVVIQPKTLVIKSKAKRKARKSKKKLTWKQVVKKTMRKYSKKTFKQQLKLASKTYKKKR